MVLRTTLHTWDWEPVTITLQALSLVEKVELVQVRFTLHLRDQRSIWMQDRYKTLHGVLQGIVWIMFHSQLEYFQKPPLGSRLNTKPGDHDTPNADNRWFNLLYHVWGHIWLHTPLEVHDPTTWFWRCLGTAFGHFLLGAHNFMVTALGTSVKYALHHNYTEA